MNPLEHLRWPFFEPRHREFSAALDSWAQSTVRDVHGHDVDAQCKQLVQRLGEGGWLRHAVAGMVYGGAAETIDTRMLCLARETLARH
ncbi:MAG: acyl-CoA dehydrogenase, partial [Rubrivivax sp.]|nr:acyl-CoA dehydrogenase [Rubrivivax sp.]